MVVPADVPRHQGRSASICAREACPAPCKRHNRATVIRHDSSIILQTSIAFLSSNYHNRQWVRRSVRALDWSIVGKQGAVENRPLEGVFQVRHPAERRRKKSMSHCGPDCNCEWRKSFGGSYAFAKYFVRKLGVTMMPARLMEHSREDNHATIVAIWPPFGGSGTTISVNRGIPIRSATMYFLSSRREEALGAAFRYEAELGQWMRM